MKSRKRRLTATSIMYSPTAPFFNLPNGMSNEGGDSMYHDLLLRRCPCVMHVNHFIIVLFSYLDVLAANSWQTPFPELPSSFEDLA